MRRSCPSILLLVLLLGTIPGCTGDEGPDPHAAAMQQARQAAQAGRTAEAEQILDGILQETPRHEQALVARGQMDVLQGRTARAAERYVTLAEMKPSHGLYALRAGTYLEVIGKFQDAGVYLARAVQQRPDDPGALYRLGLHRFNAGDYGQAEMVLARAHDLEPGRADVAIKLAQTLEFSGRAAEALQVLDRTVPERPEHTFLLFVRGLVRSRTGDATGAVQDLSLVVEQDEELHRARYALARALLAAGRTAEGEAQMQRFIQEEETRRQRQTATGIAQLAGASMDDDPVLFRRRMESLVLSDPDNPEANRRLAAAYAREGDDQQALRSYRRAALLDPDDALSRREEGRILLRLGETEQGVARLREAARLAPDDPVTANLLRQADR